MVMSDLETIKSELVGMPEMQLSVDVSVYYRSGNYPFVAIEDRGEQALLDAEEALKLLDWLQGQRGNLERLRAATRAHTAIVQSQQAQREAEARIKHSEAVTAWQQGGCVGKCPSFADVVFKEQAFVRPDLSPLVEPPPPFVKQYPFLEHAFKAGEKQEDAMYFVDLGGYHGAENLEVLQKEHNDGHGSTAPDSIGED